MRELATDALCACEVNSKFLYLGLYSFELVMIPSTYQVISNPILNGHDYNRTLSCRPVLCYEYLFIPPESIVVVSLENAVVKYNRMSSAGGCFFVEVYLVWYGT